jgi:translation initiation factor 1
MAKQDKRPNRVDTAADSSPLTDNPFASLRGDLPDAPPPPEPEPKAAPSPATGFRIERARKGGYPVFLEKRPNGKTITVVRNISGNLDDLLTRLKKLCGAGGALREDAIEIQGDHRDRIETYLRSHAEK